MRSARKMRKVFIVTPIIIVLIFLLCCRSYKDVIVYDHYGNKKTLIDSREKEDSTTDSVVEKIDIPRKTERDIDQELRKYHIRQSEKYRIKIGDIFNIFIDADPNFSTLEAIVKSDGFISLKRLGEVEVEGLTLEGVRKLLLEILKDYIHVNPKLSVIPVQIKEAQVNILGEVVNPGVYSIEGSMRLLDVISAAGGIAVLELENDKIEIADLDSAYIVRENQILPVDFNKLIINANFAHNILLQDKDYIYIPSLASKQVYLLGEVGTPGKYMLSKNLSISKLIAQAGGVEDSSHNNIFVIRGNLKEPEVYKVNFNKILRRGFNDFLLKRDDIVYVPKNAITMYNDVINKILPTLNLLTSSTGAFINVDTMRNIIKGYSEEEQ